jgi:NTP pyrophosphatase (non-canonical NTP hydrolase)
VNLKIMHENWQQQTAEFAQKRNLTREPGVYALDLLSELGEVAKIILEATGYDQRPFPSQPPANLSGELGDALYSLCQLASATNVDLDTALAKTLAKYEARWQAQGHLGSNK